MRTIQRFWPALIVSLACAPAIQADTLIFNFNGDPTGTPTPFTNSVGLLTATFSSSGDPGGFEVFPSFFETLTGQVLLDPGPAGDNNLTLSILFNYSATAITLDFATLSATGVPFDLSAYNGAMLVGAATATGSIPGGPFVYPEGAIAFSGASFSEVVLSAPAATDFAIDNIAVATSIPEPATWTLTLAAAGILALGQWWARKRTR
jgi:hypothetical protein